MATKRDKHNYFFVELDDYQADCMRSLSVAFPDFSRNLIVGKAIESMALSLPANYEFVDNAWKLR